MLNKLSKQQQGILMMIAGSVLLLHALGILERGLGFLIVIAGLLLVYYGVKVAEYEKYFATLFKKGEQKVQEIKEEHKQE